ncbi:Nephrin, partial [Stegodyphus mimosarum]
MKCIAEGAPNVTIMWTFNGTILRMTGDKYSVSLTSQHEVQWTSILIVRDVDDGDYGIYTCTAKNPLGYDSADIILSDK